MTIVLRNIETEEHVKLEARIFLPGYKDLIPHKILEKFKDDYTEFDAEKYMLSFIIG